MRPEALISVLSRNSVSYSGVLFRDVLVSGSRLYSTIFRYKVPRLISRTRAASFLFHETASSTRTMCARSASRSVGSRGGPSVTGMAGGDIAAIQVHQIFDAARNGDGVSISVVRDTARYVGMAVANLVAIADPDVVVLGGLIAHAADQLLQPSQAEALRRLPKSMADSLTVCAATLNDDAGPLGAARAAM